MRLAVLAIVGLAVPSTASADNAVPYWTSIVPGKARVRTGPGRNFPATWLYQRAGLPVRVIETFPNWRRVQDPDGATGWMQANLLTDKRRMGMVRGEVVELRAAPEAGARVTYRAQGGVIGELTRCTGDWCILDVRGKRGWLPKRALWGVDGTESWN